MGDLLQFGTAGIVIVLVIKAMFDFLARKKPAEAEGHGVINERLSALDRDVAALQSYAHENNHELREFLHQNAMKIATLDVRMTAIENHNSRQK